MSGTWPIPLNCVIFGSQIANERAWVDALEQSPQIAHVARPSRLAQLRHSLTRRSYDFAIIILSHPDDELPACLLRYPELKTLVITSSRKIGPLQRWIQQGATDVVSGQRPDKCQFALERMIEECRIRAQLRAATLKIDSQKKLQQVLLDSRIEAVLLWHHGNVLESNYLLDQLLGCQDENPQSRTIEWKRWVSASCYAQLHSTTQAVSGELIITNNSGVKYNAFVESVSFGQDEAKLIRINPQPIDQASRNTELLDSSTGVLLKQPFIRKVDSWLKSTAWQRYTIIQVHVDDPELRGSQGRANSTMQELLSYRVASSLKLAFNEESIIGRLGPTTLTLLPLDSLQNSRDLAARIRSRLGNIGGLLDDTRHIHIKTLTLPTTALRASEVIDRLDRPPLLTRRVRRTRFPVLSVGA